MTLGDGFGSSPRGRGTRAGQNKGTWGWRFIPAWAGNTAVSCRTGLDRSVHPRVGGEHWGFTILMAMLAGSSPRGRGTLWVRPLGHGCSRFIPAWAGNTNFPCCRCRAAAVHPRVGGEHLSTSWETVPLGGSSPRGRGTPGCRCFRSQNQRFIPAWAGNTPALPHPSAEHAVHPRVGGEHVSIFSSHLFDGGSSPRGRGTHGDDRRGLWRARFIPAWAGNTMHDWQPKQHWPVHPRVGGEHSSPRSPMAGAAGSSPRGRGTLMPLCPAMMPIRFIPAWAGNTPGHDRDSMCKPVHPRVGGEHLGRIWSVSFRAGSSPRGRGTPVPTPHGDADQRFIPAWAGNTAHMEDRND